MSGSFQNTMSYLRSRLESVKSERETLCRKYNNNQLEIIEFDNRIKKLSDKIDMAYEIFSPKNSEISFTHKELKNFGTKKAVLIQENIDVHKQITSLEAEEKTISSSLAELQEVHNTGDLAFTSLKEDYSPAADDADAKTIPEDRHIEKSLPDSTVFDKVDFCVSIFDLDPRRVKVELANLLSSINK